VSDTIPLCVIEVVEYHSVVWNRLQNLIEFRFCIVKSGVHVDRCISAVADCDADKPEVDSVPTSIDILLGLSANGNPTRFINIDPILSHTEIAQTSEVGLLAYSCNDCCARNNEFRILYRHRSPPP